MTTTEDAKSAADAPKPMTPKTEQPVPAENTSQLTPAQRKEKAKADKAARRAAVKEARNGPPPTDAMPAESLRAQQVDAAKMKGSSGQQSGPQSKAAAQNAEGAPIAARRRKPPTAEKPQAMVPYMFSHLPMARRARTTQASKDVHPAVLAVGQQMATFALRDCILRLEATLLSFKQVNGGMWCPVRL